MLATAAVAMLVGSCGDGQNPWCEDLESVADLDVLAGAITAGDGPAAREQLDEFDQVAASAPQDIADAMGRIAEVLGEAVAVSLAGDEAEDLELRREATNQALAQIPAETSEVSAWAEEECGIRLD
ncbi:MAG: hypothetical protein ACR2OH_12350 [Microthrixaceae bacterium]